MPEASRRVAVIGAGVAGLCTLRNLLYTDKTYILTCFERGPDVGGLWFYGENTHTEEKGLPAFRSVYRDLVTSIPKQLMEFPDFPHKDGPSYLHRQQVCDYLQRYADNFGLRKYIKMNTCVQAVIPNNNERCTTWTVEYYDVRKKQKIRSDVFDYVIVCTGHHENSYTPKLEGIDDFQGDVLHILDYRVPEPFAGKTVAILGAAFSGVDVAFRSSSTAKKVFLCHDKKPLQTKLPPNVIEKPGIKRMIKTGIIFNDATQEDVDALIFCTGYRAEYPFLSTDILQIERQRITPLYKHFVHIKFPTLFFVGIPKLLCYFPQSYAIARAIVAIMNGKVKLPSEAEMLEDEEQEFAQRKKEGFGPNKAHFMGDGDRQWRFNKEIAEIGGFDPLPATFQRLWDYVTVQRDFIFGSFRKHNFRIIDFDKFMEV
ncbi:uncharacterized protein [Argopecten irradians]|uniref:uncharacterized protein n=1 Tax=Argopecten irradians TaxID=31199 RepID=UPI00370FE9AF